MTGARRLRYLVFTRLLLTVLAQRQLPPDVKNIEPYYFIPEDTPINSTLFNFTAKYDDNHRNVTVTTTSNIYVSVQEIDPSNGLWGVTLITALDREAQDSINLYFNADGDVSLPLQTTLYVSDVNDNAPKFQNLPYTAKVKENTAKGISVYHDINATDPDSGQGGVVHYSMNSVDQDKFLINATSGVVTLNGQLDYETTNFYHYIVTAKDGGGLNSTTDLFITVQDVQDTPPFFTDLPYIVTIKENTRPGTTIINITAQDGDRDPSVSTPVTYSISGGQCAYLFDIKNETGELSIKSAQLDRDSKPLKDTNGVCNINVQAIEGNSHPPQLGNTTATQTVTVTVLDLNDNPPKFSRLSYTATVRENSPPGVPLTLTSTGQITVSDNDQGNNSAVTLLLLNMTETFALEQNGIQTAGPVLITVKDSSLLDFEKRKECNFEIMATDSPTPGPPMSAFATVTVSIEHVNEFAPEFSAPDFNGTVPEGSAAGHTVLTVTASDKDRGGNDGTITYSLQDDQGTFDIDSATGVVTVSSNNTDREVQDKYVLLVQARDGGGLLNVTSLTITIEDVNDEKPVFRRNQYDAILPEEKRVFSRPLSLEATDDDQAGTPNSQISYSLSNSSSPPGLAGHFQIDPHTGSLTVKKSLDFDSIPFSAGQKGAITLTAVAQDHGQSPLNSTVEISITLLDINDKDPIFQKKAYSVKVPENAAVGTVVFTAFASDDDGSAPNNVVNYFISSGGQDRFRIDATSGNITVSSRLNREDTSNYTLNITARDQAASPRFGYTTVHVTITDINDELPTFGENTDVTIDVNETALGRLYVMAATDPDLDSQLRYSVLWDESSGQSGSFAYLSGQDLKKWINITQADGTLEAVRQVNKTATRKFTVSVLAEDTKAFSPKPQLAKGVLTVNVIDINNNPPHFTPPGSARAHIKENSGAGTALNMESAIHVADLDENENSQFELALEGEFAKYFEVYPAMVQSSADVIIKVKNSSVLDFETRQALDINITAKETLTAEKHRDALVVHLVIDDENDNSPAFTQPDYQVTIQENTSPGTIIYTVQATDADGSEVFKKVTYSLPDYNELFRIDNTTGIVSVAHKALDYEERKSYSLTVEATDGGGRRVTSLLNVRLTDVNDNSPVFQKPEYSAFVTENAASFGTSVTVNATDADEGDNKEITYSISNASFLHQNFTINATTGELRLVTPVDYESLPDKTRGVVTLLVAARDNGVPSLNTTVSVIVTVKDTNDCTPLFGSSSYNGSIPENATADTLVATVCATDADGSAPNNAIFFVLASGGSGNFRVDSTTGQVRVAGEAHLDRETAAAASLTVLVLDRGDPPRSSSATINVSLSDVNDELPVFKDAQASAEILENAAKNAPVFSMTATDRDSDPSLVYDIVKNETQAYTDRGGAVSWGEVTDWFAVNSSTGDVYVNSSCDRETAETVVLTLRVTDIHGVINTPQRASAKLTIKLNDVNDNQPAIEGPQRLNVSEAVTVGTEVASFTASDRDRDQTVTFGVPDASSPFLVTPDGKVSLRNSLDREREEQVSFILVATDSGTPSLSSNVTVVVTVIDANDNAPNFTNPVASFSVHENATLGKLVAEITASDADEGDNGKVSFSFTDDVQNFEINSTTGSKGEIRVRKSLDRETKDLYTLSVVAFDNPLSDFRLRSTQQIEIRVLDVNDNAPEFHPANTTIKGKIVETGEKGDEVYDIKPEVKVTDKDLGQNANLTFRLAPLSGDINLFTIDEVTGIILVNSSLKGQAGDYSYLLTASDRGDPPLNSSENVTLRVIDVNLNSPRFVDTGPIPPVPECVPPGTRIYTFNATDDDKDKDTNGKVQYFIDNTTASADDLAFFRLNPDTGVLRLAEDKHFDSDNKSEFRLLIFAKDKGLPESLSTERLRVTITINDTNDNSPKFSDSAVDFEVEENKISVQVGSVRALDPDADAKTCYEIDSSGFSGHFAVRSGANQEGVIMLVKPLDREQQSEVDLTVTARDCTPFAQQCEGQTQGTQTSSMKVRVNVKDVNDNPPVFTSPVIYAGFLAKTDYGKEIINLQELVTDPDIGPNRIHGFYPVGQILMDAHLNQSKLDEPLKLAVNGSLRTNRAFTEDTHGLFTWHVLANDSAGRNDALLKIFIAGKDNIVYMSFFHSQDEIRMKKSEILSFMTNVTDFRFIDDGIEDFVENDDRANLDKSRLVLHAVDKNDNLIDAATILSELDHNTKLMQGLNAYQLLQVQTTAENQTDAKPKLEYILMGIIVVLVIAFLVTLVVMISNIHRFKRKLKAFKTESFAMGPPMERVYTLKAGTMRNNPIFGREQTDTDENLDIQRYNADDTLDDNSVDARPERGIADVDEQEVTIDLYGIDATPVPPRKGNPLLDEILQEQESKVTHEQTNGLATRTVNGHVRSSRISVKVKNATGQKASKS